MHKKITQGLANSVKADEKPFIVWDTQLRGFGLRVMPSGRKTYIVFYRTESGQQRKPSIGKHPAMTAEKARKQAANWLAQATTGKDPSGKRAEARKDITVKELAETYMKRYAAVYKKPSSIVTDRSNLDNHVIPLLGSRKVKDVTRADISRTQAAILAGKTAKIEKGRARGRRIVTGGPGVANRVLALLSKMFACAEEWGIREGNPARGIRKYKGNSRDRFLDRGEIKALLQALTDLEHEKAVSQAALDAIRMIALTGMRRNEVCGLKWSEIDLQHNCIRFEDTKTGKRTLPLPSEVSAIIARQPRIEGHPYVFASAKQGSRIALARPWYMVRDRAGFGEDVSLHTLRHTFAAWAVMGGLSLPETGAMLGHRSAQTTLRYAHHAQDAIRSNMDRVGSTLRAMADANDDNVVRLRQDHGAQAQ